MCIGRDDCAFSHRDLLVYLAPEGDTARSRSRTVAVGFGCCKAGSRPSSQGDDAISTVRRQRCVSGKLDRALVTPTEDAHGSAAGEGDPSKGRSRAVAVGSGCCKA